MKSGRRLHTPVGPYQSVGEESLRIYPLSQVFARRLQTVKSAPGSPPPSMFSVIRTTISKEGVRSLYTGLTASILRQMTYSLTRLGAYEKIKEVLSKQGKPSAGYLLIGAMVAGGAGGVAGNPAGTFSPAPCAGTHSYN